MPVRKHDWLMSEISFITSSPYGKKIPVWEKRSFINTITRINPLRQKELSCMAAEAIRDLEHRITLKAIAEAFDIPYQGVRRYAAENNWTVKRLEFWINVANKAKEKMRRENGT